MDYWTSAGTTIPFGVGVGTAIAVVCSWERHKSIGWAILAGILGWFYVIYFWLTRKPEERKQL